MLDGDCNLMRIVDGDDHDDSYNGNGLIYDVSNINCFSSTVIVMVIIMAIV